MTNESLDYESLYELINEDTPIEEAVLQQNVDDLVDIGLIIRINNIQNDEVWYTGKPGLQFSDFSAIDDPIKNQILLQFIENPTTQFVLFNTQKGKSKIVQNELMSYARLNTIESNTKQVCSFLMLDNDTTLGDQTIDSLVKRMSDNGVKVDLYYLSSSSKNSNTPRQIGYAIDSYAAFPSENAMPLIVALTNTSQLEKVVNIVKHIQHRHITSYPNLLYAFIWDEADKTYTWSRDRSVSDKCIRSFTLDDTRGLHRNTFVTATEGLLIEDFPECANAHNFKIEQNEQDDQYYRAFHSPESIIKILEHSLNTKKNNVGFSKILAENQEYFKTSIIQQNGLRGFRKTIINSNVKGVDMRELAGDINKFGGNGLVFNQTGLTVYKIDSRPCKYKTKGCSFNELLYYVYVVHKLDTAPLFILGRKKVDRGLGFHYAPRHYNSITPKRLQFGKSEPIETNGIDGLIWTDIYLGNILIKPSAVQKAGRLAGIIAHSPQYAGSLTFWTSKNTADIVYMHYEIVDATNSQRGCSTIEQAMERARRAVEPTLFEDNHTLPPLDPYKTVPVIIDGLTDHDMIELAKKGIIRKQYMLNLIKEKKKEVYEDIESNGYVCDQITTPTTDGSYKKHIEDIAKASVECRQAIIDIKSSDKRNVYNCYIDKRLKRIIIVRWKGVQAEAAADVEGTI